MVNRRRLLIVLAALLFFSRAEAQNLPLYRIAYATSGENPTALWIAVEQGFYKKHGVNAEVLFMRSGPLAMAALAAGDVQAVFTSANNVLNGAAAGLDLAVLATVIPKAEGAFVARPEIKKPEDVKGKLVGIQSIGGGGWANNMLALDYLNLDPDRDRIQFVVFPDQAARVQALEIGRIQAAWLGYTFSEPLKKKGYSILVDLGRAPISYLGTSLVTRRMNIRQDVKGVEALIKGTLDGVRFVLKPENRSVVIKMLMRRLRLSRVEDAESGYESLLMTYSADLQPNVEGVRKIHKILSKANPNLAKIKPEDIIDDSLVRRLRESGY
ncbi:MAG TPA: ABC transporter substrate-binding protein [Verrucomicrobiae bacterium]|jgi:NitT/TauT family transport system substrate-binding protein|nr:ABC transporter substrate-binding protein [Verrucomicrobiae bacterium]